jgi:hypothetical protein
MEFHKAGERLMAQRGQYGGARPCALVWVIQFAQEDLQALATGGLLDRLEEVNRFSFDAGISSAFLQGDTRVLLIPTIINSVSIGFPPTATPLSVLMDLQRDVYKLLDAYVRGQEVKIESGQVSYEVTRKKDIPNSGRVTRHMHGMKDAALLQVLHLLAELGHRIKTCTYCEKLFLAGRMDKQFCSGLCQAMQYKKKRKEGPKDTTGVSRRKKGRKNHGTKR